MTKTNRPFTLVELLVVIAIIAPDRRERASYRLEAKLSILAAMLLPVLSQARGKGRDTLCIGNQ
jgi:hypothetical protein